MQKRRCPPATGPRDLVKGQIKEVRCSPPSVMDLTLLTSGQTMKLHADDYFKVEFAAANFNPTGELFPCRDIQGYRARIVFRAYKHQPNEGQLITVILEE